MFPQILDVQVFPPILWLTFPLSCWGPVEHKQLLILTKSILSDFSLIFVLWGPLLQRHRRFVPVFSFERITVFALALNFYVKRGEVLLLSFASGHPVVPVLVGRPSFLLVRPCARLKSLCRFVLDSGLATDHVSSLLRDPPSGHYCRFVVLEWGV